MHVFLCILVTMDRNIIRLFYVCVCVCVCVFVECIIFFINDEYVKVELETVLNII